MKNVTIVSNWYVHVSKIYKTCSRFILYFSELQHFTKFSPLTASANYALEFNTENFILAYNPLRHIEIDMVAIYC